MGFFGRILLIILTIGVVLGLSLYIVRSTQTVGPAVPPGVVDGPGMVYNPFDTKLERVRYSLSGDENGSVHSYSLTRNDDGTATFEAYDREFWYSRGETRTYEVEDSVLDEIADIASKHYLQDVGDRNEGYYILDGNMWSLRFETINNDLIDLEEYQGFSSYEYEGIHAIVDTLASLDTGLGADVVRDVMKIGVDDLTESRTLFYVVEDTEIGEAFYNNCLGLYELREGSADGEKLLVRDSLDLSAYAGNKADGSLATLVYDPREETLLLLAEESELTSDMMLIATPEDPDDAEFYAEIIAEAEPGDVVIRESN